MHEKKLGELSSIKDRFLKIMLRSPLCPVERLCLVDTDQVLAGGGVGVRGGENSRRAITARIVQVNAKKRTLTNATNLNEYLLFDASRLWYRNPPTAPTMAATIVTYVAASRTIVQVTLASIWIQCEAPTMPSAFGTIG